MQDFQFATGYKPAKAMPFPIGTLPDKDRHRVIERVVAESNISREVASEILTDLLKYLSACAAYPDAGFRPTKVIDCVWHHFLLHSKIYIRFCQSLGVTYIHHEPDDPSCPAGRIWRKSARQVLDEAGISYNSEYWDGELAECNGCDRG